MIFFGMENRVLKETLLTRIKSLDKAAEIDVHLSEFDDVKYRIQASAKDPLNLSISLSLPAPAPDAGIENGIPPGGIEAIESTYKNAVEVLPTPEQGYKLTLQVHLENLPANEAERAALVGKLAAVRFVVMGARLRKVLESLITKEAFPTGESPLVPLVHRPQESYYAIPQAEQVTVVFPMRFRDSNDVIFATSFLQEFMEARRMAGLSTAPSCAYSPSPPLEFKDAPPHALNANAGYVSFVVFPRHVEGGRLDKTAWILSTFYSYVSYHIKCSKAFMHTRMRRRVDSLIQVLNRARPDAEKEKKTAQGKTFVRKETMPKKV